ncbi:hypothetical protein CSC70_00905 [Pseudoxanthomonas kalamensis DSM 18571]|uniref:hypothetical protein n=1 Tax=Pseudoxanthomonas kalamensis TaxID=289483 RepID=UPI0013910ED6|nr:hypothetical protein [Pseudoxanthomonas kalamensis]KAF1712123.1 hypothetical protein CSC70_00905 [Pseudoxanthomonas kalamensis DSM 18571]
MPVHRTLCCALLGLSGLLGVHSAHAASTGPVTDLLGIEPSAASLDYLQHRQQFQLHSLLTEQRHPETMDLSRRIAGDTSAGLDALYAVDRDVTHAFAEVAADPARLGQLQDASRAMQDALRGGHRIYFYGTGSTGRLAETLESGLWRPFWQRAMRSSAWPKIEQALPGIGERVRGEITGGDRAMISSLEGFEDLQLIGRLQLQDNGIASGDVVFAVTEGGETSAVIGTALAASELNPGHPERTWFVYNNPDSVLLPFERSRRVIEDPAIRKISLPTGPQSITGSTRMQATTTSLYALGMVLEDAVKQLLTPLLTSAEMQDLGFDAKADIASRLRDFAAIQKTVAASAPQVSAWTNREAAAYAAGHHATYLAQRALMPVFVDVTERAPTFRLAALDPVDAEQRRSWIQVWAPTEDPAQAWQALLQRPFHGLDPALYKAPFDTQIDDAYLHEAAQRSLAFAGAEQQHRYDLAWSPHNREHNGPQAGDLGALILLGDESAQALSQAWLHDFANAGAGTFVVAVDDAPLSAEALAALREQAPDLQLLQLVVPQRDPFGLSQMIALKMMLNGHSTGIMAKLGRVVGNTMTAVQPGNLKLIGRATYLIQLHVNAVLGSDAWRKAHGQTEPLSYAEANAVLFDVIEHRQHDPALSQSPEVELAIVRVLESLREQKAVSWDAAAELLQRRRLDDYLGDFD